MAVARPQAIGGTTGLKAALIAFVAVAVVSLTFTIILYTYQSDLLAEAAEAKERARRARTETDEAEDGLRAVATRLLGEVPQEVDAAQVLERITQAKRTALGHPLVKEEIVEEDSALVTVFDGLFDLFSKKVTELEEVERQRVELTKKLNATLAAAKARDEEFTSEINQLKQQYADLARESAAFSDKTRQEIESLQADWEEERERIGNERDEERGRREEAEKTLEQERDRNEKLLAQLAAFRPSEGVSSVLQIKDGNVVRTFASNDIVYIDLGRRDGLKPGMTFSVYSADRGIPADGRGKAAIEVTNLDDKTSECRVTRKTASDPILEGDVIANPVFDRFRQFNFAVVGDFDLDFDGMIDDPGGKEVARLIQGWGGKVVGQVDTRTDFVVLGAGPPPLPPDWPPDDVTDAELERAKEIEKNREVFEATMKDAKALSVPILARAQFLNFLGYGGSK